MAKKGLQANKSWECEAVWFAVVLRLFIVIASCYEESSNFSPVVTFKFEIEKNHKRNWIKTCLFTG